MDGTLYGKEFNGLIRWAGGRRGSLHVSPNHFFVGLDQVSVSAPDLGTQLAENPDALELMNAFKRLKNKDMRRVIVGMISELAGPDEEAPKKRTKRKQRAWA